MPKHFANKKVVYDGFKFDSIDERERYKYLRLLEAAGRIRNLEVHPVYRLHTFRVNPDSRNLRNPPRGNEAFVVARYTPDFEYEELVCGDEWKLVVEDVKGIRLKTRQDPTKKKPQYTGTITARFRLNQKWMKLEYGIEVRIVAQGRVI